MTGSSENATAAGSIELSVGPRHRDLVGFQINRVWPIPRRRLIGPFIFLDHMLPCALAPGHGLDVPPHPHIGLATVTWLFAGELMHRDSLGTQQLIRPGELNWMIAGRGITHSERSSDADRAAHSSLHGTQAWVALSREREAARPDFIHITADEIPERSDRGVRLRLLAGRGFGLTAKFASDLPLHYAEVHASAGSALDLAVDLGQRAVYVVSGELRCNADALQSQRLFVFADGRPVRLQAQQDAHFMLLGGPAMPEDRHVWWNFVASTTQQIDAARERWAADAFPPVPGDTGRMSMPAG